MISMQYDDEIYLDLVFEINNSCVKRQIRSLGASNLQTEKL